MNRRQFVAGGAMAGAVNIYGPPQTSESLWDARRVNLFNELGNPAGAGTQTVRFSNNFQTLYIERVERLCHIFVGAGRKFDLGEFFYGTRKTITLPSPVDELVVEWGDANDVNNVVPIPFGTSPGSQQFTDPILDIWTSSKVIYFEEAYNPNTVLQSTMDFTLWDSSFTIADRGSSRALLSTSYAVVFRRSTRPYRLSLAHVGNDRLQAATIWHGSDEATGSRTVRLRRIEVLPYEMTAVGDVVIDLVFIVSEPSGGVALTETPLVGGVAESVSRVQPSTPGVESGLISSVALRSGASFFDARGWITLYDDTFPDAMHPPQLTRNVAGGFAVITDSDVAQSVRLFVRAWFTEQVGNLGVGG